MVTEQQQKLWKASHLYACDEGVWQLYYSKNQRLLLLLYEVVCVCGNFSWASQILNSKLIFSINGLIRAWYVTQSWSM